MCLQPHHFRVVCCHALDEVCDVLTLVVLLGVGPQPMVLGEGAEPLSPDLASTVIQAGVTFFIDVLARADVRPKSLCACWSVSPPSSGCCDAMLCVRAP